MRFKMISAAAVAGAAFVLPSFTTVSTAATPASLRQSYTCAGAGVSETGTAVVSGKAAINSSRTTVKLKNAVYTVSNNTGFTATVTNVVLHVPDPSGVSYKANSAKVTTPGWTAGHDSHGAFARFAGPATVAAGATIPSAPFSAKYEVTSADHTVIDFQPGLVTFTLTSPISAHVVCTPNAPVGTFASVKL
jgi:hypothetical protein